MNGSGYGWLIPTVFWGGFAAIAILSWLVWDRKRYGRRETRQIPVGFFSTEEVNIDPVSGIKERVYYNPRTGERIYIEES